MGTKIFDYSGNRLAYIESVRQRGKTDSIRKAARKKTKKIKRKNTTPYKDYKARQAAMGIKRSNPGNINVLTPRKLALMTDRQLQTLASDIARTWENDAASAIEAAKRTPYHTMPVIKPSKQDYARVKTQPPTDADIAAAPSKQKRFLRRRQRKYNAAKKRIEQYNIARQQPAMSVYDARMAEINRSATGEFGVEQIVPTRLSNFLRKKNVLADTAFVNSLIEHNRGVLESEILDAANMVGKRTRKPQRNSSKIAKKYNKKKVEIYKENQAHQYDSFEEAIKKSMGKKGLRRWRALSKKQRQRLWDEGAIVKTVFSWIDSDPKTGISASFDSPRQRRLARQTFNDYMTMAVKDY